MCYRVVADIVKVQQISNPKKFTVDEIRMYKL